MCFSKKWMASSRRLSNNSGAKMVCYKCRSRNGVFLKLFFIYFRCRLCKTQTVTSDVSAEGRKICQSKWCNQNAECILFPKGLNLRTLVIRVLQKHCLNVFDDLTVNVGRKRWPRLFFLGQKGQFWKISRSTSHNFLVTWVVHNSQYLRRVCLHCCFAS